MRNARGIWGIGPGLIGRVERRQRVPVGASQRIAQLTPGLMKRVDVHHRHQLSKRVLRRQGHHGRQHGLPFPVIGRREGRLKQSAEGLREHGRHRGVGGVPAA